MEFSSRGFQRNNARPATAGASNGAGASEPSGSGPVRKNTLHKIKSSRLNSALGVVLFISLLVLVVAIIFGVSTRKNEDSYVNNKEYQAVFLNGGQVYFGKVNNLNDRYINLTDIYYLNVNDQSVQPESSNSSQQNLSLVKLGCELHGPKDQMIINREQVTFWENLKDDSRVVTAIKDWQSQNKDGQKCETQAATQQQPSATTDNTGNNSSSDSSSPNQSTSGSSSNSRNSTSNSSSNSSTGTSDNSNTSTPSETPAAP